MSLFKYIDSKLMRLFTYNFLYPDWSQAPLNSPFWWGVFYLIMGVLSLSPIFRYRGLFEWSLAVLWLTLAVYHFRLWRRLKSERAGGSARH